MQRILIVLVTIGSLISIGFGVWHFFVPTLWNWYAYIDERAPELVLAVRAINFFFSLCLTLLGIANLLIAYKASNERFSLGVMLAFSSVLWGTRVVLQLVYPQGSQNSVLQYSMLVAFSVALLCFALPLFFVARGHAFLQE